MPLAQAKFTTWWHYIQALGINAPKNVGSVVVPFLEFCYGRPAASQAHQQQGQQPVSPVKKFESMTSQCLEAFAHVLNCPVEKPTLAPLEVKSSLIAAKDLLMHHAAVMNAVTEAMNHIHLTSKSQVDTFEMVFTAISTMVHSLDTSDRKGQEAIDAFLTCSHGLVSVGGRNLHALSLSLFVLEEVRKLSSSVLCPSSTPTWEVKGLPATEMLKLLLDPILLTLCSVGSDSNNTRLRRQLLSTTEALIKKACSSKANALKILEGFMTALEASAKQMSPAHVATECQAMWKIASAALKLHIDRHEQINQLDSSLDHHLGACEKILEFPLKRLAGETNRSLWKGFTELARLVIEHSDAIVSVKPLEMQKKLCNTMEDALTSLGESVTVQHVTVFSKILGSAIIADIPLSAPGDLSESLRPVIGLFGPLSWTLSRFAQGQPRECGQTGVSICSAASALLTGAKSQGLIKVLVTDLLPHLRPLLDQSLLSCCGKAYEDAAELVLTNSMNLLQSRYSGPVDAALAETLSPFLVVCMSHPRKYIKTKSQQMWQVTFASSLSVGEIPAEISTILKRSLILSSESTVSSGSSFEDEPVVASSTFKGSTATGTPTKIFGSFLQKSGGNKESPSSSKHESSSNKASPLRTFRKPPATRVSLEDESTQNFVPITNSGKKRRPLTEHQKEKMTTRRDDIPALYSELSRDDSQMVIPRQFMSQGSMEDESSQVRQSSKVREKIKPSNSSSIVQPFTSHYCISGGNGRLGLSKGQL